MAAIDWRLYAPFRRLARVAIGGLVYHLPENNPLLRGFQFLQPTALVYCNFCWNAICHTCRVTIESGAPDGPGEYLACQLLPCDGLRVAAPPAGVRLPPPHAVEVYEDLAVEVNDDSPEEGAPPAAEEGPGTDRTRRG